MTDFNDQMFSAPQERIGRLTTFIKTCMEGEPAPKRILDIGCGSGEQLIEIIGDYSSAKAWGVDISAVNIKNASAHAHDGITFEVADYMVWSNGQFDLIISDSCFHLINMETDDLLKKVADDTKPGGSVILTMPTNGMFNRLLFAVRRVLSFFRCRLLDGMILLAARILHPNHDVEMLRQRVAYMYIVPTRLWEDDLIRKFENLGLSVRRTAPMAHSSLGQAIHAIAFLQKNE